MELDLYRHGTALKSHGLLKIKYANGMVSQTGGYNSNAQFSIHEGKGLHSVASSFVDLSTFHVYLSNVNV